MGNRNEIDKFALRIIFDDIIIWRIEYINW
jgi:hypothetical protein